MECSAWLLSGAAEAPESESERFLDSLRSRQRRTSLVCSSKERLIPALLLHITPQVANGDALLAFAQLAQYAGRFGAHSPEKAAFYDLMLRRQAQSTGSEKHLVQAVVDSRLIAKNGAPRFIVDIVQCSQRAMCASSIDALVAILVNSDLTQENAELVRTFLGDSVRLRFKQSELTTNCLLLLQRGLDQVAAQPASSRLNLSLLSLKKHKLGKGHFALLADIVKKNNDAYGIRELELDSTLTSSADSPAFETLLSAIFQPPTPTGSERGGGTTSTTLRRVSLSRNALGCSHYAVICSALRYGSAIEEVSLASTMDDMDTSERQVCWRWLAFGLFYPRSRKLNSRAATDYRLRRIDLAGLIHDQEDIDAFAEMVQDPVTGLDLTQSLLRICTLKAGSAIRVAADEASPAILAESENGNQRGEFEVFFEGDGWACVVVPAVGLGWVATSQLLKTEQPSFATKGDAPRLFDLAINSAKHWASCMLPPQPFVSFVASVGSRLRSLDLSGTAFTAAHAPALAAVATRCNNLRRLVLDKCGFDETSSRELVSGLRGEVLGYHLASLSLNECVFETTDHQVIERVCALLGDATKLLNLKHLHLNSSGCTQHALSILYGALTARKRLTLLELHLPPPTRHRKRPRERSPRSVPMVPSFAAYQSFDAKFHNELVGPHLTAQRRAAFLSALKRHQETPSLPTNRFRALAELDVVLVRIIFQFTSSNTRRKILWRQRLNEFYAVGKCQAT